MAADADMIDAYMILRKIPDKIIVSKDGRTIYWMEKGAVLRLSGQNFAAMSDEQVRHIISNLKPVSPVIRKS
jgi:hypothetical protein